MVPQSFLFLIPFFWDALHSDVEHLRGVVAKLFMLFIYSGGISTRPYTIPGQCFTTFYFLAFFSDWVYLEEHFAGTAFFSFLIATCTKDGVEGFV